jgi:iron complex transport system ATP-binding protein
VVAIEQVCFAYERAAVLRHISFRVERGERLGILGPNGSGKSTLLKILAGVLEPAAGCVRVDGRDIQGLRRRELARLIAVVPQEHHVVFPFTVEDVVLMGRTPHLRRWPFETREDRMVVQWALDCTGTRELAKVPLPQLSSGEKQRVIIARAIAQQPKLLLLDEFTASLDIRYQLTLHALVDRLCAEQSLTVVMVSHDLNLASRYCDRLLLLEQGSIVVQGKPADVLQPEHIERAFGVQALIDLHPVTQRLYVLVEALHTPGRERDASNRGTGMDGGDRARLLGGLERIKANSRPQVADDAGPPR